MNWFPVFHAVHVLAAGVWVGGLVFTTAVVSPAFKRMGWTAAERIAIRSAVGRQYAGVAGINLVVLFFAALCDWLPADLGALVLAELSLILLILFLSGLYGRVFAPRLAQAAREPQPIDSVRLQRISIGVSLLNLLLSAAVGVLASLRNP